MVKGFLKTSDALHLFLLRIGLAVVIFPHGAMKLFGWFGGDGWSAAIDNFSGMGIPAVVGALIVLGESLGMIALFIGFFGRFMAASLVIIMIGATVTNFEHGFFMNWSGEQEGEGIQFYLLTIIMGIAIVLKGSGKWSVDRWLSHRF